MFHNDYQKNLILTPEDFADCGWKEVLAGADRKGYYSLHLAFSGAAKQAIDEDRKAHGKALMLLANVCSMVLLPTVSMSLQTSCGV